METGVRYTVIIDNLEVLPLRDETNYNLKQLEGKDVVVQIKHKIYGTHKINCIFNLLQDEEKIGLTVNGHGIYVTWEELEEIKYSTGMLEIVGTLQTIKVKAK